MFLTQMITRCYGLAVPAALAAILTAGCGGPLAISGGDTTGHADPTRTAWLDRVGSQSTVTENDALRGAGYLLTGEDLGDTFAARVRSARQRNLVDGTWSFDADRPISRDKLAYILFQALDLRGGLTLTITGPSRRYCYREAVYRDLLAARPPAGPVDGPEFAAALARAAERMQGRERPDMPAKMPDAPEAGARVLAITPPAEYRAADSDGWQPIEPGAVLPLPALVRTGLGGDAALAIAGAEGDWAMSLAGGTKVGLSEEAMYLLRGQADTIGVPTGVVPCGRWAAHPPVPSPPRGPAVLAVYWPDQGLTLRCDQGKATLTDLAGQSRTITPGETTTCGLAAPTELLLRRCGLTVGDTTGGMTEAELVFQRRHGPGRTMLRFPDAYNREGYLTHPVPMTLPAGPAQPPAGGGGANP